MSEVYFICINYISFNDHKLLNDYTFTITKCTHTLSLSLQILNRLGFVNNRPCTARGSVRIPKYVSINIYCVPKFYQQIVKKDELRK